MGGGWGGDGRGDVRGDVWGDVCDMYNGSERHACSSRSCEGKRRNRGLFVCDCSCWSWPRSWPRLAGLHMAWSRTDRLCRWIERARTSQRARASARLSSWQVAEWQMQRSTASTGLGGWVVWEGRGEAEVSERPTPTHQPAAPTNSRPHPPYASPRGLAPLRQNAQCFLQNTKENRPECWVPKPLFSPPRNKWAGCDEYSVTRNINLYKLASPRKAFYLATFFST